MTAMTPERQFGRLIESREQRMGRVLGIEHPTLRLFAHDRDGNLSLRVLLPEAFKVRKLVSTRGIEVDTETRYGQKPEIAFVSKAPAMDTIFLSFVRFAIDRSLTDHTEVGALGELFDAYDAFRRYMETENALSAEAIKGLAAELHTMGWLIENGWEPSTVLTSWKGPFKDNKDFVMPDGAAFEVKSVPLNAQKVRISSPEQLEPNGLQLSLIVIRMENADEHVDEAVKLGEMVESLRHAFEVAGVDPVMFDIALEAYGLKNDDVDSRDKCFVFRAPAEYRIADEFPRISPADLHSGISGVLFQIALEAMAPFFVEPEGASSSEVEN